MSIEPTSIEPTRLLHRLLAAPALVLLVVLSASLLACGPDVEEEGTTKTIDVEPAADVPEVEDPKEIPRGQGLSGILPGDFPPDLPLYLPASLVDFGETEEGAPWVELLTPRSPAVVGEALPGLFRDAGWQVESLADGEILLAREGRIVRVVVRDGNPGTLYRISY